jgi:hypothetical protein
VYQGFVALPRATKEFTTNLRKVFISALPGISLPFPGNWRPAHRAASSSTDDPQWSYDINRILYSKPTLPQENKEFKRAIDLRRQGEQGGPHLDNLKHVAYEKLFRSVWLQHREDGADISDLFGSDWEKEQQLQEQSKVVQLAFFNLNRRGFKPSEVRQQLQSKIAEVKHELAYAKDPDSFNPPKKRKSSDANGDNAKGAGSKQGAGSEQIAAGDSDHGTGSESKEEEGSGIDSGSKHGADSDIEDS